MVYDYVFIKQALRFEYISGKIIFSIPISLLIGILMFLVI
jgi:hypothetical protein